MSSNAQILSESALKLPQEDVPYGILNQWFNRLLINIVVSGAWLVKSIIDLVDYFMV